MHRLNQSLLLAFLVASLACTDNKESDTGTTTSDTDGNDEDAQIIPTEGEFEFYGQDFSTDECNITGWLSEPTHFETSEISADGFVMSVYDGAAPVGQGDVQCTYSGDQTYDCEAIEDGGMMSAGTNVTLLGVYTLVMSDEASASGTCDLNIDCEGDGCGSFAQSYTNSGAFPCNSVQNWSAGLVE